MTLQLQEVESLSKSIYTILKVENLFQKSDFHERYAKQLFRIGEQFNVLRRKEQITNDFSEEYIKWHNEKAPDLPMTKNECLVEITTLLCSFGLTHYEFLKRFFIETLFLDKLQMETSVHIGKTPTYGTLIKSFQKLTNYNQKMNELFDVDLRNALAHDSWYLENTGLQYKNFDNKIITISYTELPLKITTIGGAYTFITSNYFKDYFPDIVQLYDGIGSKRINEFFPLYGMNKD